ncbi:hypothetical protein CL622_04875 [archaeon]|nr:hypothetical protein [archaeon]
MLIETHAFARIGLMGNPSDGYFGKTIACTFKNFKAEVKMWESPNIEIVLNETYDPLEFGSIDTFVETVKHEGYYGGARLLRATCYTFFNWCSDHDIELENKNFTVSYDTSIPRQVGLGGSSAIITATVKALMEFYNVTENDIAKPLLSNMILEVETKELGITAGLQDRVAQVYEGAVFMDFAEEKMKQQGHGDYIPLDKSFLPPLFLAYTDNQSFSGKIHSEVRVKFEQGDETVSDAMRTFAQYAIDANEVLIKKDYTNFKELMNKNFELRRSLYGDVVIGKDNLEMIRIAKSFDCPAKFAGSGGAVVGMYDNEEQFKNLEEAYTNEGFSFVKVET